MEYKQSSNRISSLIGLENRQDIIINNGASKKEEQSNTIEKQTKLAEKTRSTADTIGLQMKEQNGLDLFQFPIKETYHIESSKLRRFEFGSPVPEKNHRIILLTGMTGSGKSLLINNMINYIYGVSYTDKFRFKLIVESEEIIEREEGNGISQSESMTSWVSSYTFHWQEGFRIEYSLTIIDTPGFGDTRGLQYDIEIVNQIRLFLYNYKFSLNQKFINIGFVIQASQASITEEQKYMYYKVLSLFAMDTENNIFIVLTFADTEKSTALEVIKSEKIPFADGCTFEVDNSAVYSSNCTEVSKCALEIVYESFKKYFEILGKKEYENFGLKKKLLHRRQQIRLILENMQQKISSEMDALNQIEDEINSIFLLKGTISENRNYQFKKLTFKCRLSFSVHPTIKSDRYSGTCHKHYDIAEERIKTCATLDDEENCDNSYQKHFFDIHTFGTHVNVCNIPVEIHETIEEMMKRYDITIDSKNDKRNLLEKLLSNYQIQKMKLINSIKLANETKNTAVKKSESCGSCLSRVDYIDRLIQLEEQTPRPNTSNRVYQLRCIKSRAEISRDFDINYECYPEQLGCSFEEDIAKRINQLLEE